MLSTYNLSQTSFGLKEGRIVAPGDVIAGLACGCTCPGCGAALIAKKGKTVSWHFAHHDEEANLSCYETAIHAAAKQVLVEANSMRIPALSVTARGVSKNGAVVVLNETLGQPRWIEFEYSQPEIWIAAVGVRPDVIGFKGPHLFLVEMYFSHKVDDAKRQKLQKSGLPSLEIDLSDLPRDVDLNAVKERVLQGVEHKKWLYHPKESFAKEVLRSKVVDRIRRLEEAFEAEKERDEHSQQEAQKVRQNISEANKRYRGLSPKEKEKKLYELLGITTYTWPSHLNKAVECALEISEPPHVWQGALFERFIFGEKNFGRMFSTDTIVHWVNQRMNIANLGERAGSRPVEEYLYYLCELGFLEAEMNYIEEVAVFEVKHTQLTCP